MPVFAGQGPWTLLYKLTNADMQSTADQAFTKVAGFTEATAISIIAMPKTGAASVACVGGIYDAVSKGGNLLLPNTASFVALTASASPKIFVPFQNAGGATSMNRIVLTGNLWLSLTTGSTAACTADIMIYGVIMS